MSFHIDKSIPKEVADIMREGYTKIDSLWPISHIVSFVANTGKTRNGYCKKISEDFFQIAINKDLVKKEDILEVVCHELLHSYPSIFPEGHKGTWKERARIVQQTYNIQVQRCNNFERSKAYQKAPVKFRFECTQCKTTWDYRKKPKWYGHLNQVGCPHCKKKGIIHEIPVRKIL